MRVVRSPLSSYLPRGGESSSSAREGGHSYSLSLWLAREAALDAERSVCETRGMVEGKDEGREWPWSLFWNENPKNTTAFIIPATVADRAETKAR